jgi:hypothetical protein
MKMSKSTLKRLAAWTNEDALKEIERLRSGYKILRDCSDSEMGDGDLAREIANKMLGMSNVESNGRVKHVMLNGGKGK